MQDAPLLISGIIRHGENVYAEKKVLTVTPDGVEEATFYEISKRAERLAAALTKLGVQPGDRVATFMWNNQAHMEVYIAVPCMGAVLHTLNIRLFPEQLAFIINHAEDSVIIVDSSLMSALAKVRDQIPTVKHIIVHGPDDTGVLGRDDRLRDVLDVRRGRLRVADVGRTIGRRSCVTRRARPATPRASSTRIVRPGCTRWPRRRRTRSASLNATDVSSSSRCSTSTPGARRTPRSWPARS